jgi:hypothetical protein
VLRLNNDRNERREHLLGLFVYPYFFARLDLRAHLDAND